MKIGIVGAGFIARAVATTAIRHGHDVMVSNTRTPDTLFSLTRTIGCKAGTPEDAAAFGDAVFVAIPLKNYQSIPVKPLEGKVLLDADNYYPDRDGHGHIFERMMQQLTLLGHTVPQSATSLTPQQLKILFVRHSLGEPTPLSKLSAQLNVRPGTLTISGWRSN